MSTNNLDFEKICPKCKEKNIEPRHLPCGKSLCIYCIQSLENAHEFKCFFCHEIHQTPSDGLSIQEMKKNFKTDLNNEEQKFRSLLDEIDTNLKQVEFDISNGDYIIKEYCRELRRQVQLTKETKIEEINRLSDDMINQIDSFETDKLNNYINFNTKDIDTKLNEIKGEVTKWNSNLDSLKITQNDLDLVTNLKIDLISRKEDYLSSLYGDKLLEFYKKLDEPDSNCIGRLVFSSFSSIDFNDLEKIDLNPYLDEKNRSNGRMIDVILLENNDYLVFLLFDRTHCLKVYLFNENRTLKKTKTFTAAACGKICTKDNKICINYVHTKNYLSILDENLNELMKIQLENLSKLVGANNQFIFVGNLNTNEYPLSVYDWSLNFLKELGQRENPNGAYYLNVKIGFTDIGLNVFHFEIRNKKCYVIERINETGNQVLRIIDETNGLLVNTVNLKRVLMFYIDKDERVMLVDSESESILVLNKNGMMIKQIKLSNFPDPFPNCYFNMNSNFNLHIIDCESLWLSVKKNILKIN